MTRYGPASALALAAVCLSGCDPSDFLRPHLAEACLDPPPTVMANLVERTVLAGDVVHCRYALSVGSGPFEEIGLHRVVREPRTPPVPETEGILLLPGAPQFAEDIFMSPAAPSVPVEEGSVALFLASNDVDVWSVDFGWTALPHDPDQDLSFLSGWGIAKDALHVAAGFELARSIRSAGGHGAAPIHLLGFSYGGFVGYAVAADDARHPPHLRNVKGLIPVESAPFKAVSTEAQEDACLAADSIRAEINAGSRVVDRSIFRVLGQAALAAPDEPSALIPPFTNYNAPLAQLVSAGFFGGAIEPPDVTLFHSHPPRVIDLLAGTPPYLPRQSDYDIQASLCDGGAHAVPFDDHLGDLAVPIFYVDRADRKLGTIDRTSSTDITSLIVNPDNDPTLYGHADFFLADNAANEIWRPILDWIEERQ